MEAQSEETLKKAAEVFRILADETRLKIFEVLEKKELCVADIVKKTGSSQPAISHQLRLLRQMDLVRTQRKGHKIYYRIADGHVFCIIKDCLDHISEKQQGNR